MTVLARFGAEATVAKSPGFAAVTTLVSTAVPFSATIELDAEGGRQAQPTGRVELQLVGWEVSIGGSPVDGRDLLAWSVVSDETEGTTWSMELAHRREIPAAAEDPYGNPAQTMAPITAGQDVTIIAVYQGSKGRLRIPLLSGGIVQSGPRRSGTDSLSGVDALGAYDRRRVDLEIPAGHGLDVATVIRRIFTEMGATGTELSFRTVGRRMDKPVSIHGYGYATASEIARTSGRVIRADPRGRIVLAPIHLTQQAPVAWSFTDDDIVDGAFDPPHQDIPTRLLLRSSRQVAREDCGLVTTTQEVRLFGALNLQQAAYRQNDRDTLISLPSVTLPTDGLQELTILDVTRECDAEIRRRTRRYSWHRRQAARYLLDGGLSGSDPAGPPQPQLNTPDHGPGGVYLDAGAVAGDDASAWLDDRSRWRLLDETTEEITWGGFSDLTGAFLSGTAAGRAGIQGAYLAQRQESSWSWINPEAGLRSRALSSTAAWDATPYEDDRFLSGDRRGLAGIGQTWQEISRRIEVPTPTPGGYKTQDTTQVYEIVSGPRNLVAAEVWQYAGEDVYGDEAQRFQLSATERTLYLEVSPTSHVQVVVRHDELTGGEVTESTEDVPSYLPAAEMRETITPPAELFETEAEAEAAVRASRYESQPMEHREIHDTLERYRQPHEIEGDAPWAEDEDHLAAYTRQELLEGGAAEASFQIPACWTLRVGQIVRYTSRSLRLDVIGAVRRVQHSSARPVLTAVTIKVYVL